MDSQFNENKLFLGHSRKRPWPNQNLCSDHGPKPKQTGDHRHPPWETEAMHLVPSPLVWERSSLVFVTHAFPQRSFETFPQCVPVQKMVAGSLLPCPHTYFPSTLRNESALSNTSLSLQHQRACSTQHPASSTQHLVLSTQHPTPNTQHPMSSTKHPAPNAQHPTTQHPTFSTQYPAPNTQHSTPSTQHPTSHL